MDALTEVAERLNKASDQLGIRIKQEEATLKSWNLGVACWVVIGRSEAPPHNGFKLGYTNELGDWKLCIIQMHEGQEKQWELERAPRGLRLYGLRRLPLLKEHLLKAAISLTTRIEKFLEDEGGDDDVQPGT